MTAPPAISEGPAGPRVKVGAVPSGLPGPERPARCSPTCAVSRAREPDEARRTTRYRVLRCTAVPRCDKPAQRYPGHKVGLAQGNAPIYLADS